MTNTFRVIDVATGFPVAGCGSAASPTMCTGEVTEYTPKTRTFRAVLSNGSTVLAQSSDVRVTWRIGSCDEVPAPAELCTTQRTEILRLSVYEGEVPPGGTSYRVAGYVDVYRKTVGTTTVSVPCVVLVADTTELDPCASAGGTFVSRTATLVDASPGYGTPDVGTALVSVAVRDVKLTLLVAEVGVNSTHVPMLC